MLDWGCTVETELQELDGLYGIEIRICDPIGQSALKLFLDGWSGNVSVNGKWEFFFGSDASAENTSRLLHDTYFQYLEQPPAA